MQKLLPLFLKLIILLNFMKIIQCSPFAKCIERDSLSAYIYIDVSGCDNAIRCPLHRGYNTTIKVLFIPIIDTHKQIERVISARFDGILEGKSVELPLDKVRDTSNEILRSNDGISLANTHIVRNEKYKLEFTYKVPIAAAKGSFDLRLIIREKLISLKNINWQNHPGRILLCVIIPFKYT